MRIRKKAHWGKGSSAALAAVLALSGCNGSSGGGGAATSVSASPVITTAALPVGDQAIPYRADLLADGSSGGRWELMSGSLPSGLAFVETGHIEGTPVQHGSTVITVSVVTPTGKDTKTLSLRVRPKTSMVSSTQTGVRGNQASGVKPNYGGESGLSGDGRYVVFQSLATNLVADDTNGKQDFFLQDRLTGEITRVSVGDGSIQGDRDAVSGAISEDGNVVAFMSFAGNLVPGDSNYHDAVAPVVQPSGGDIFIYDRTSKHTSRISQTIAGADGICAAPPANNWPCNSFDPALNRDGNLVVFGSTSTNLVPGDTNDVADIFVYDRTTQLMERVSVDSAGAQADGWSGNPGISADGRYVIFESTASNLLGVGNDTNGATDIFVHDRQTHTTTLVSKNDLGQLGNHNSVTPSISRDGKWIAFWSAADNLVGTDTNGKADIFAVEWNAPSRVMKLVSQSGAGVQSNDDSRIPVISGDGRYVVFESAATNLVDGSVDSNGVTDIFVADLQSSGAQYMKRASVNGNGEEAMGGVSETPSISADGRFISFASEATNLEEGDTNGALDVFVTQRL